MRWLIKIDNFVQPVIESDAYPFEAVQRLIKEGHNVVVNALHEEEEEDESE